jgi:transcriptional repressor NrdR
VKCPFCDELEDKVVDSRMAKEGELIRRRRECLGCKRRYTTYERVEEILPVVVKKDGRRETFDRSKILSGLKKACEKRPISTATIEAVTDRIEKRIQEMGETEIESRVVGEELMKELHQLDQVAYVRFASVYREFKDIDQFMDELRTLAQQRRERCAHDPVRRSDVFPLLPFVEPQRECRPERGTCRPRRPSRRNKAERAEPPA